MLNFGSQFNHIKIFYCKYTESLTSFGNFSYFADASHFFRSKLVFHKVNLEYYSNILKIII